MPFLYYRVLATLTCSVTCSVLLCYVSICQRIFYLLIKTENETTFDFEKDVRVYRRKVQGGRRQSHLSLLEMGEPNYTKFSDIHPSSKLPEFV